MAIGFKLATQCFFAHSWASANVRDRDCDRLGDVQIVMMIRISVYLNISWLQNAEQNLAKIMIVRKSYHFFLFHSSSGIECISTDAEM